MAQDLKAVYRTETKEETKEALARLREHWDSVFPRIVSHWEAKIYALLAFLKHPKPVRRHLYATNQLERLAKEVKQRTKVIWVFL